MQTLRRPRHDRGQECQWSEAQLPSHPNTIPGHRGARANPAKKPAVPPKKQAQEIIDETHGAKNQASRRPATTRPRRALASSALGKAPTNRYQDDPSSRPSFPIHTRPERAFQLERFCGKQTHGLIPASATKGNDGLGLSLFSTLLFPN